ncbi:unnamed protein product, partial [Medioppia subpectinata]
FSTLPRNAGNSSQSSSGSSRLASRGRAPPAPPKRDPTTTLSISRARARSLLLPNTSGSSGGTSGQNRGESGNGGNDYDSEGRSTKSSSPTTSIESMIVNNKAGGAAAPGSAANKVASIRSSRQTRRISSYELEEFFSRQTDDNDANRTKTFESMTALKKKKGKSGQALHKNFNSTPDIQKQLAEQLAKQSAHGMSASEEELFYSTGVYAQTVALRGGKIIAVDGAEPELSTNFDANGSGQSRAPAPTYPPPPPPPAGQLQTSV